MNITQSKSYATSSCRDGGYDVLQELTMLFSACLFVTSSAH